MGKFASKFALAVDEFARVLFMGGLLNMDHVTTYMYNIGLRYSI